MTAEITHKNKQVNIFKKESEEAWLKEWVNRFTFISFFLDLVCPAGFGTK